MLHNKYDIKQIGIFFAVGLVGLVMIGRILSPATKQFCRYVLESDTTEEASGLQALPVDAIEIKPETVYKRLFALGELKAKSAINIKLELPQSARIEGIDFTEGQEVKKGDVLIRFDDREYRGQYQRALAEKERAEAEYNRAQRLQKSGSISKAEFEKAKAGFEGSMGELNRAKSLLDKCKITASIDGTIGIIENFRVGEVVRPETPIVNLVDNSVIRLDMQIPSKNITDLEVGQSVLLNVQTFPGEEFKGEIVALDSSVNTETRTLLVRAEVENPENKLKPGMIGNAQIITGALIDAFVVSDSSIISYGEKQIVFVVERGRASFREIITSFAIDDKRVVESGLKKGMLVVAVPGPRMVEGVPVKIQSVDGKTEAEWKKSQPASPPPAEEAEETELEE